MSENKELIELAERCEAADAREQRKLLQAAYKAVFGGPECTPTENFPGYKSPRWDCFHAMLDAEAYESAAMTLVPVGWHTGAYYEGPSGQPHHWLLRTIRDGEAFYRDREGKAATAALALTAACLRALASQGTPDEI